MTINKNQLSSNVVGVIQARMGSTRFPGKVMQKIVGKPLIWHMVNRLQKTKTLSTVVVATTNTDVDKPLHEFLKLEKIPYYAGSENDILDRLYNTGKKFNAHVLVKINGDSPLVDPTLIDIAVKKFFFKKTFPDLVTNSNPSTFPEGLQFGIFNFNTLCTIQKNLKDKFWREYIYMYIIEKQKFFSVENITNNKDLSSLRWTVDYPEDFDFVCKIFENLYVKNKIFTIHEILDLLKNNPELQKINEHLGVEIGYNEYEELKAKHTKALE